MSVSGDDIRFSKEVSENKKIMTLPFVQAVALNEMPLDYRPCRAEIVAMAQLLLKALEQNQEMAARLERPSSGGGIVQLPN